jgi:acyl carrier protein
MDRRATILKIIQAVSKKNTSPSPEESLFDSGLLDSFALTDLVAELEKQFGIRIPDADLNPRKFDSVERIEEYLTSRG